MADPRSCLHNFERAYQTAEGDIQYVVGHRCVGCDRAILGDDGVIRDEQTYEVLGHADPPQWPDAAEDEDLYEDESDSSLLEG